MKAIIITGKGQVAVQEAPRPEMKDLSQRLQTTAVFDGVGGAALNDLIGIDEALSYASRNGEKAILKAA